MNGTQSRSPSPQPARANRRNGRRGRAFRIVAKRFFLTYPRCDAGEAELTEFLNGLDGNPVWYAASEQHGDGGQHWHVLLQYQQRHHCGDERAYDYRGFHPNIQAVRSFQAAWNYLSDPDKVGRISTISHPNFRSPDSGASRSKWSDVIESSSADEFFDKVKSVAPRDYCLNLQRLEYTAAKLFPAKIEYESEFVFNDLHLPQDLIQWRDVARFDGTRPMSLILCGPSRTGKTEWARSLGPHTYWYGQINIDTWNDDMEYLILDDFSADITKFLPLWKGLFGAQRELNLTQKYRGISRKKYGKPCIFLCNQLPILSDADQVWMDANALTVRIYDPLF